MFNVTYSFTNVLSFFVVLAAFQLQKSCAISIEKKEQWTRVNQSDPFVSVTNTKLLYNTLIKLTKCTTK